jgi:hypothetical protein
MRRETKRVKEKQSEAFATERTQRQRWREHGLKAHAYSITYHAHARTCGAGV